MKLAARTALEEDVGGSGWNRALRDIESSKNGIAYVRAHATSNPDTRNRAIDLLRMIKTKEALDEVCKMRNGECTWDIDNQY